MFKQTLAAAFVAAAFVSAAPASAGVVFDGFGDAQARVSANTTNPTSTSAAISVTDTVLSDLLRTISVTHVGGRGEIAAEIFGDLGAESGFFSHSQDALARGTSRIDWFFSGGASQDLSAWSGLALNVTVLSQDVVTPGNPSMSFSVVDADGTRLNGVFALSQQVSPLSPLTYSAKFDAFAADVSSTGSVAGFDWSQFAAASLTVNGSATPNLDVAIEVVEVPAPAPLALLGLGLVGLGVARRRRA